MIDSRKLVITPNDYEELFKEMRVKELKEKLNSLSGQQFRRLRRKLQRK
jgi:tetrahydromethanopterin S-methyltransferase subunit G